MDKPKKGEYWHIRYGQALKKDINKIVMLLEDLRHTAPNWRMGHAKVRTEEGETETVNGSDFVEKFL